MSVGQRCYPGGYTIFIASSDNIILWKTIEGAVVMVLWGTFNQCCTHVHTYTNTHTNTHTTHVHMHGHTHMHTYMHTHTRKHMHTYTHTHTHTHTKTLHEQSMVLTVL